MRSNSISSVSDRASSAEPEETMQIFVKNLSGDSKPSTALTASTRPLTNTPPSLPHHHPRIHHSRNPALPASPAHQPPALLAPPRLRRQAPHRPFRPTQITCRHPRVHHPPRTAHPRRRPQEDPLRLQGLPRRRAAHCRRLRLLLRPLLRQAPHAGVAQLPRARGLQTAGQGAQQGEA
jgi:hypothetical protein